MVAHGDARERKWRGNWRMGWVASTLHTTSKHGVSSIITADAHASAASSRPNWRPRRFKWTRPFRRKTKSGFCACAVTFQLTSTVAAALRQSWTGPSFAPYFAMRLGIERKKFWSEEELSLCRTRSSRSASIGWSVPRGVSLTTYRCKSILHEKDRLRSPRMLTSNTSHARIIWKLILEEGVRV